MSRPRWGLVATIKAPTTDVLKFAAHHLELDADDITIFLDDCNAETAAALADHPRVHTIQTDEAHWKNTIGRRPKKHQVRQVRNASYHYRRASHLDWVAHIDVDEFICPSRPVSELLAGYSTDTKAVRVSPCETLGTDDRDDRWFPRQREAASRDAAPRPQPYRPDRALQRDRTDDRDQRAGEECLDRSLYPPDTAPRVRRSLQG